MECYCFGKCYVEIGIILKYEVGDFTESLSLSLDILAQQQCWIGKIMILSNHYRWRCFTFQSHLWLWVLNKIWVRYEKRFRLYSSLMHAKSCKICKLSLKKVSISCYFDGSYWFILTVFQDWHRYTTLPWVGLWFLHNAYYMLMLPLNARI